MDLRFLTLYEIQPEKGSRSAQATYLVISVSINMNSDGVETAKQEVVDLAYKHTSGRLIAFCICKTSRVDRCG